MKKEHKYSNTGWGFIILSVFCVVIFLIDYKTKFIFNLTSISELGTILGGTSGIFASLASLFFVLENLELQRQTINQQQESIKQQQISIDLQKEELKNQVAEMKESNAYFKQQTETLKTQTSGSTFFQLLENQRKLVMSLSFGEDNGYSGLARYYRNLRSNTEQYYKVAYTGLVTKSEWATFYPIRHLGYQIENVEQLHDNILNLIQLIRVKLDDDLFYHEIFYNALSKGEKYILGLYVVNERPKEIKFLKTKTFNYLEYFESSGNGYYKKDIVPFFPNLSFVFTDTWLHFHFNNFSNGNINQDFGDIKIEILNNEFSKAVLLKSTFFEYNWFRKEYSKEVIWNKEFSESASINVFKNINDHVLTKFVDSFNETIKARPFIFHFTIKFIVIYNEKEFTYTKRFGIDAHNYREDGADLHLHDV